MPAVKPLDQISDKWKRVASVATPEYEAGIRSPRRKWAEATANSEAAYTQGVQQAIARKSFSAGVKKAGDTKWQENALAKGPARWQQGVELSQSAFETGFKPFRDVIERTALPERGPKGDPKNINRVAVLAKALHDYKVSQAGR